MSTLREAASEIIANEYVIERFCYENERPDISKLLRCARLLALDYFAEHPADDDEPITDTWLRACGFRRPMSPANHYCMVLGEWLRGFHVLQMGGDRISESTWYYLGREVPPCKTRGQLRLLCRALGIELGEKP